MFSAFLFVFPAFSVTLPSGYTELRYIESTGTQYIDTGVLLSATDKVLYDVDFEITQNVVQTALWGSYKSSNNTRSGYLYIGNPYLHFAVGGAGYDMTDYPIDSMVNKRFHWLLYTNDSTKERTITDVDTGDILQTGSFSNNVATDQNIFLFGISNSSGGVQERSRVRFYSFKITKNNTLVRDLVPVRNSSGVVGLYDTVNNVFYTNSGTGSFIAGPVVLPCGYTQLEYIESGGTQYIDTGVYADKNTEIEMVVKTNGPGTQLVFGVNNSYYLFGQTYVDSTFTFDFGTRIKSSVLGYDDFHKIEVKNQSFRIDDAEIGSFASASNFTQTDTAYLFEANLNSWASDTGSKIKYLKIWQSGTLIHDYIPVKNPDGVIGMYDSVSGDFFPNAETKYTQLEYLKSSGTQYIEDTSFTTITTGAIEIKTKDLTPHARFVGWGAGNNYLQVSAALATPNSETNFFPFCYSNSWNDVNNRQADITAENVIRYEFSPGLQKLYVNGIFDRQGTASGSVSTYPFRLFKVSLDTSVLDGYGAIYYCKVFNNDGVLKRYYIPVRRDSDGVLGMYDTTTRAFLQNVGTGTFTVGADLDTFPNSFIAGPEIASNNSNCQVVNINWGDLSEPEASGMCVYGETFTVPSVIPTAAAGYKFLGWRPI